MKKIKVVLKKSFYGRIESHIACVKGLGLRRLHQEVEVEDNPCVRGMIEKVRYLLEVKGE